MFNSANDLEEEMQPMCYGLTFYYFIRRSKAPQVSSSRGDISPLFSYMPWPQRRRRHAFEVDAK
jgi:hypothetical protein